MADYIMDQAAGLRRMLAVPRPRRITLLSTLPAAERNVVFDNLCAGMAHAGSNCLLIDARRHPRMGAHLGVVRKPALLDAARGRYRLEDSVQRLDAGYSFAVLQGGKHLAGGARQMDVALCEVFDRLSSRYDSVFVDAELDEYDSLPASVLERSRMVVHIGADAESIKAGYAMIKRLAPNVGNGEYGVLVSGTEPARAGLIYANLAKTASRYLAVSLQDMGSIPPDDHLGRAARLGRSVIDAFPLALASAAFRRIAGQLSVS